MSDRVDAPKKDIVFQVPRVSRSEAEALQALRKGEAEPHQQRKALFLIVNKIARPHDLTYVPESQDRSAFMAGRSFVGQQILKFLKVPVSKLPEEDDVEE